MPTYRLVAVNSNGTAIGLLPAWSSFQMSVLHNEGGSLEFEYAVKGVGAEHLVAQREIAVYDEQGEIPDGRFIVINQNGNLVDRNGVLYRRWTGRNLWSNLDESIVRPPVYPSAKPKTDGLKFANRSPGYIMDYLINQALARGELAGHSNNYSSASPTGGGSWTYPDVDVEFAWGWTIRQVLNWFIEQGYADARMRGRVLEMFNPGALGVDRTTGANPVVLWAGQSMQEVPEEEDSSSIKTVCLVKGKDNFFYEYADPIASQAPPNGYGKRVTTVTDDTITTTKAALRLAQKVLANLKDPVRSRNTKYSLTADAPVPFRTFDTGDLILSDSGGSLQKQRVVQITLNVRGDGEDQVGSVNLTLNARFSSRDVTVYQTLSGVTGGTTVGGSAPATSGRRELVAPGQVSTPILSTGLYWTPLQDALAQLHVSWTQLTANEDGTPMDDFDHYEVFWRYVGDANWQPPIITTNTSVTVNAARPGQGVEVYALAVDQFNNRGAASPTATITLSADTTPPNAPSKPTTSQTLGVVRVGWDGLDLGGAAMPNDFREVSVHMSPANGAPTFVADNSNRVGTLNGAGAVVVAGLTKGATYYAKLVARDTSGNPSPPSAASDAVVPLGVTGIDFATGSIGYDAIAFKDFDNLVVDGSFENPALDNQRRRDDSWVYVTDPANAFHRDRFARGDGALSPGTYRVFDLTGFIDVRPGDQFFARCAYRRSVGANGTFKITVEAFNSAGAQVYSTLATLGTVNGLWTEMSTTYTPAADVERLRFYAEMYIDVTTGLNDLDAVEIRHIVGTSLIQDAAISRAKIQNLAVDSARIADLDGGKIWAQSISTEELKIGVLGKNLVPNSSFEDDYGWTLTPYNVSGSVGYYDGRVGLAYSGSRSIVSGATAPVAGESHGMSFISDWFPVKPGSSYRQQVFARASVAMAFGLYMRMEFANDLTGAGATGAILNEIENKGCGTVYEEFSQEYTAPAGKNAARMFLHHYNPPVASDLWFDDAAVIEIGVGASQLTAAGLKVWDITGDLVIDMTYKPLGFGNTFAIMKGGSAVASIDSNGRVNASEVFTDKITLDGADLEGTLDTKSSGVVTSSFTWPLTGTATARKGLGELSFMHKPGRNYRVIFNGIQVQSSIAGDRALVSMRYTIDGSTPTVSNGIIADGIIKLCQVAGNGYSVPPMIIMGDFVPGAVNDTLVRILITIERFSGSGTLTYNTYSSADPHRKPFRLFVEDIGFDVPDTFLANDGSATAPAGSKTRYTKTYNASWSQTYQSDNGKNTVSGNDAYQGYYSSTNGNQKALIGFPAQVQADLGAGTVEKCEVYLYFFHWYNNSGGTAIIGTHGNTAEPATAPAAGFNRVQSSGWPKPGGRWVNLGTAIGSEFKSSGATRGITLGPGPSSGSLYYGKAYGATGAYPAKLRITYVK